MSVVNLSVAILHHMSKLSFEWVAVSSLYSIWMFMWKTVQMFFFKEKSIGYKYSLFIFFLWSFSCYFRPFQCEDSNKEVQDCALLATLCICTMEYVLQWNINWVTTNVFYMWKYSNMLSVLLSCYLLLFPPVVYHIFVTERQGCFSPGCHRNVPDAF